MLFDYSKVTRESITSECGEAIEQAEQLISAVEQLDAPRTYENTLVPLDWARVTIEDAFGRGPFMGRVHPHDEIRSTGVEAEERLSKFASDIIFRRPLYLAVADYAATEDAASLQGNRRRDLDFWLRDFRRAGHELAESQRVELQDLQRRIIELEVEFSRNLDEWEDYIEVATEDLAGLPDTYVERLRPGAQPHTYRVTMEYPEYHPFMDQAQRRDLRQALQFKFWNRAATENNPLLTEAVAIRARIAEILGYPTWADYSMELKMAKHPKAVAQFYEGLVPGLTSIGETERTRLQAILEEDHPGEELATWDWTYYDNELRRTEYGVDQNEVAAYFSLERVIEGMFSITGKVFGLEYRAIDPPTWHEDVAVYEIWDRESDEPIAVFYADLFPREGKFSHAACFQVQKGLPQHDAPYRRPVAAIVANFTKPTPTAPSLLKHREAITLFHEFGHVLHVCLTAVDHPRFSGIETETDFVEAPSQIMENWMWEPEVLQLFARHYETGEVIPGDLLDRLVAARDLNIGLHTMRQIFLGQLDLALHTSTSPVDPDSAARSVWSNTLLPYHEDTHFTASFGHLMGGYDAAYYGYLWARVFGDDMFSVFAKEGVTSPGVGSRYRREVLARGHSRDAEEHLKAFLGREPSNKAFLKRLGLDQ